MSQCLSLKRHFLLILRFNFNRVSSDLAYVVMLVGIVVGGSGVVVVVVLRNPGEFNLNKNKRTYGLLRHQIIKAGYASTCDKGRSCPGRPLHSGSFCQFPSRWIYYYSSNKSIGEEAGKTHLCVLHRRMFCQFLFW